MVSVQPSDQLGCPVSPEIVAKLQGSHSNAFRLVSFAPWQGPPVVLEHDPLKAFAVDGAASGGQFLTAVARDCPQTAR